MSSPTAAARLATGAEPDSDASGVPRASGVDVTVVLPVHDEVGHVRQEIERIDRALAASPHSYELLVVDDGSTDGSKELLRGMEGIELVDLPTNHGVGFARRLGTRLARGAVVVWTDVDMSYPNDRIPWLVDSLEDWCDQVVGARKAERGTHAWARRPAKWFIRNLACFLVRANIPDLNSGFRAFRRDVALPYLHLLPNGFSCVSTITLAFLSNGHGVRYVDIDYGKRAGRSKFRYFNDTYNYLLQVIRMVMTFNPLRVFLPVGGALLLLAVAKVLYDSLNRDFWITTNAVILTVVAWQVIAIGLLADLICRLNAPTRQGRSSEEERILTRHLRRSQPSP